MSRVRATQPLLPSVLDRLIDLRPDVDREPTSSQTQVLHQLRQTVRRDLENLLNSRCRCRSWPEELTELSRSMVSYGVPDLSGADIFNSERRRIFLRTVEEVIRKFEPRFTRVKVVEVANADLLDRTLRFRIDALLRAYPAPEPIVFDSSLEPGTRNFEVQEPRE